MTTTTRPRPHRGPYASIGDIQRANAEAGQHYFEPDTMRFFSSRVSAGVHGGRYFVTGERRGFDDYRRAYTVRIALDSGHVETVGEFLAYSSSAAAHRAAERAANAWPEVRSDPYPPSPRATARSANGSELERHERDGSPAEPVRDGPRDFAWRVYVDGLPIGSRDTRHHATQLMRALRRDHSRQYA